MVGNFNKKDEDLTGKDSNWLINWISFAFVLGGLAYSAGRDSCIFEINLIKIFFPFAIICVWLLHYYRIYKSIKKSMIKGIKVVLLSLLLLIIMLQFGGFCDFGRSITSTGFTQIKPQLSQTGFGADGRFLGVFTNGAKEAIIINEIKIQSFEGGDKCLGNVLLTNQKNNEYIQAGDNVKINASGCGKGIVGEIYNKIMMINYSLVSTNQTFTEKGTIRGPYQ